MIVHTPKAIKVIKVLIGQIALTRAPNILQSVLGSCVGLSMYDPEAGIAGLAHVLLPNSRNQNPGKLPGKFADLAVPRLYSALIKHGASSSRLKAKIAGGARMFNFSMSRQNDIGGMNIQAVEEELKKINVLIISKDIKGNMGRKVEFDVASFDYKVEKISSKVHMI